MSSSNASRLKWGGFTVLMLFFLVLGWRLVPCHWSSIWMDRNFSCWVYPIANRLQGQARLYADGLHSPMPPLPFILMRLLFPHGAIWIDESRLNFIFQCATLSLLYFGLCKRLNAGLALASVLMAVPVFFSLTKTILYDSMTQFFVAALAMAAAGVIPPEDAAASNPRRQWLRLAGTGCLAGLLMLTKQSTGFGAVAGVCVLLLLLPEKSTFTRRCANTVTVVGFMILTILAMALILSREVDPRGMVNDVFLTGSQTKGGTEVLLNKVATFCLHLTVPTVAAVLVFTAYSWWRGRKHGSSQNPLAGFERAFVSPSDDRSSPMSNPGRWAVYSTVFAAASFIVVEILARVGPEGLAYGRGRAVLLVLGCIPVIYLVAVVIAARLLGRKYALCWHPLAPYAFVFVPAAVFHRLSVGDMRWFHDNNPLIVLAAAFLLAPLAKDGSWAKFSGRRWVWPLRASLLGAGMFWIWCVMVEQLHVAGLCTERWPEISQLAGARFQPQADGMRRMVNTVRSLADARETVLLLPNDPDVEAWFDRPRPDLSCAIVFADQYWDRSVDKDFAELKAHAPKIIIIGPRKYWHGFTGTWQAHGGAVRLIDRVREELLPASYGPAITQEIHYHGGMDFMDIYVRRNP